MATKSKDKLKKKQFKVADKIIDLERFAYDVFVHAARKFGVPEKCICSWGDEKNEYVCRDFIAVLSRTLFKHQIRHRFDLYGLFKAHGKPADFKTFEKIRSLLQNVIACSVRNMDKDAQPVLQEVIISLSVINELILFLYSQNCNLYLKELSKFWFQYWCCKKKNLERVGGLAQIYNESQGHVDWDVFFDQFIPEFCIPYESTCVSSLKNIYQKHSWQFMEDIEKNLCKEDKNVTAAAVSVPTVQENLRPKECKMGEFSVIKIPMNIEVAIPSHEDVLRATGVFQTNAAESAQNIASTSRQETKTTPGSSSQKEEQQKKSCSRSSFANFEQLYTRFLETDNAPSTDDLPSTNVQETEMYRRVSSNRKVRRRKSSSSSHGEDLGLCNPGFSETFPQNLVCTNREESSINRRKSSEHQREEQSKSSSHSTLEDLEQLNLE